MTKPVVLNNATLSNFALMGVYGIQRTPVEAVQAKRQETRGGFEQRLKLIWSG